MISFINRTRVISRAWKETMKDRHQFINGTVLDTIMHAMEVFDCIQKQVIEALKIKYSFSNK